MKINMYDNNAQFQHDLLLGKFGEQLTTILLTQCKGYKCEFNTHTGQTELIKYDIQYSATTSNGIIIKQIEVKTDLNTHQTGNLFIEIGNNGKASGILATTANIYAYVSKTMIFIIDAQKLKRYANLMARRAITKGNRLFILFSIDEIILNCDAYYIDYLLYSNKLELINENQRVIELDDKQLWLQWCEIFLK